MNKLLLVLSMCATFAVGAQNFGCATDEMHQKLFEEHPQYNPGIVRAYERLQADTELFKQQASNREDQVYIIPVVFHVIHNYGPENISDAQVHDAIRQANIQLRKLNADTTDIVTEFKSRAADCFIELRLAQLDPEGNCTNGITRTVSSLTSIGDHQVKNLIQWPPDRYLNVYVCAQAAGLAGHALLPAAADTIPQWDGIVMQGSYIGTIGTSDYFRRTVLTHEIGHYLNLQHIWGGNNVPNYYYLPVAQASNCDHDDEVDDTPLTIGWQTCPLGGTSCGTLDNVQNYMDYAYCARMFTEGQRDRMHACLNSSVANRNNLWQPANLVLTGTDDETFYLCKADFSTSSRTVCVGQPVELTDLSVHGVTSRLWSVPNSNLVSGSWADSVVTVSFSEPGTYSVGLTVSNAASDLEEIREDFIRVLPATGFQNFLVEGFEVPESIGERWVIVDRGTPINWEVTNLGYTSNHSIFVNNFEGGNWSYEFHTIPINAAGMGQLAMSFDYAYAQRVASNNDVLQIAVSTDCGQTWATRKAYNGATNLRSVTELYTEPFVPNSPAQWTSDLFTNFGAANLTDNLMIRFRFEGRGGNNLYIDNIRIGHPDELAAQATLPETFSLFPNPAAESVTLRFAHEQNANIEVYNLAGQVVQETYSAGQQEVKLDTQNLSEGYYLVRVGNHTVPLIKQN
jgi:PKD repeat protein